MVVNGCEVADCSEMCGRKSEVDPRLVITGLGRCTESTELVLNPALLSIVLSPETSISEVYRKFNCGNWLELVQIKPVQQLVQ